MISPPEIVFEDSEIYVINKPSGVSSQDDLTDGKSLTFYFKDVHVITRLDKRVSGLTILAKNPTSAKKYSELILENRLQKTYHCIVAKKPENESGTLTHWLKKESSKARVFDKETKDTKRATLHYKVVQSSDKYHLLEIKIETGRFHQIRAQLGEIGSPIVGDLKYGFKRSSPDGSIFLCCTAIITSEVIVSIPFPEIWGKYGFET